MVLVVIDTQKGIMNPALYRFDEMVSNIKTLIDKARTHQIEVIFIRHDNGKDDVLTPGNPEYEIVDAFQPLEHERIFNKCVNSPFKESGLLEYVEGLHEQEIMIVGIQTDLCVHAAVTCGFEHGFHMIVPAYTNSTYDNAYMSAKQSYEYYNNYIWKDRYAQCLTFTQALKRMK